MRLFTIPRLSAMHNWRLPQPGMKLTGQSGKDYLVCEGRYIPFRSIDWAKDAHGNSFNVRSPACRKSMNIKRRSFFLRRFEMAMKAGNMFKGSKHIWQVVDTILPDSKHEAPRLIHEEMGTPLVDILVDRFFTRKEIKTIMKSAMLGLREIEGKGFMHAELGTAQIFVHTEAPHPSEPTEVISQLWAADQLWNPGRVCNTLSKSGQNPYRAPEVYFRKPCSFPAHIWSWGMILTHLLETRASMIHDRVEAQYNGRLLTGWGDHRSCELCHRKEDEPFNEMVGDFGINHCEYYADCKMPEPELLKFEKGDWKEYFLNGGIRDDDVCFLDWVLDPSPDTRPTSEQIMQSGYLEWNSEDDDGKP